MTRIFLTLAVIDAIALLASYGVGVMSKLRDPADRPGAVQRMAGNVDFDAVIKKSQESKRGAADDSLFMVHFSLGLFAALATLLVHCLIFTYLLGTGRWVKEVAIAYRIPDEPLPKLTRELKRRTFPPALFAMLFAIATVAAGAGAQLQEWPWMVHASLATATLLVNFWAYRIEYRNVGLNAQVIDDVLREVDRIRDERGLPSNAQALAEEG